jgi:hypothetical protein
MTKFISLITLTDAARDNLVEVGMTDAEAFDHSMSVNKDRS